MAASTIDLRSDTVTRPCAAMMKAMMEAEVGDDVWGDDPTINSLQQTAAGMFGKEAGLFCPSGTMTNQIAIKCHTQPGDECICSDTAHVYLYEGGGMAFNSGVQAKLLPGDRGRITRAQIQASINADDAHFPRTSLVCLENTTNKGGGAFYSLAALQSISELCRSRGIALHLDGARVFNAIVESKEYTTQDLGALFDSISICLSKGLGCPVGSLLLGSSAFIAKAKRVRKVLGGGMRQGGFLAAAALYALEHNVARLVDDHARARQLEAVLSGLPWVAKVDTNIACMTPTHQVAQVDTNIVIFTLQPGHDPTSIMDSLKAQGVLISNMGGGALRMVTHLDVGQEAIDRVCALLSAAAIHV